MPQNSVDSVKWYARYPVTESRTTIVAISVSPPIRAARWAGRFISIQGNTPTPRRPPQPPPPPPPPPPRPRDERQDQVDDDTEVWLGLWAEHIPQHHGEPEG